MTLGTGVTKKLDCSQQSLVKNTSDDLSATQNVDNTVFHKVEGALRICHDRKLEDSEDYEEDFDESVSHAEDNIPEDIKSQSSHHSFKINHEA